MSNRRILIIEDDLNILFGLKANLSNEGYEVTGISSGDEGLATALAESFHLLLLDIMLPGLNGFEICKKLKIEKPELPIIMLTARESAIDKVAGLDYGADDYITKPFELSVLLARIRAVLRRTYPQENLISNVKFDAIEIDFTAMRATKNGLPLKFTKKEYAILHYFAKHNGEVVHRHELLSEVWGYSKMPTTRTVDNFILDIRKKIEPQPSTPKYLISISGVGYRLNLPKK